MTTNYYHLLPIILNPILPPISRKSMKSTLVISKILSCLDIIIIKNRNLMIRVGITQTYRTNKEGYVIKKINLSKFEKNIKIRFSDSNKFE